MNDHSAFHGVGVSYRPEFAPFEAELRTLVDCAEVMFDEALVDGAPGQEVFGWGVPMSAHALCFSPGRADFRVAPDAAAKLAAARDRGIELLSDHLSISEVGEFSIPNFLACDYTEENAERIAANLRRLERRAAEMEVAIENPVTFFGHPDDELSEVDFINTVLRRSDCGMLLDVNNLYDNAVDEKFDPYAYIDGLEPDRITYLHVAGHSAAGDLLVDSHGENVDQRVWDLAEHALRHTSARAAILERDNGTADRDTMVRELDTLREVWNRSRRTGRVQA